MPYGASRTAERDMRLAVSGKFSRFSTSQDNPRQRIVFAKIRKNRNAVNLFAPKAAVVSINAYFPENQACAHGAGLQGDDNFGARFPAHTVDSRQVPVQQLLVEDVAR